MGRVFKNDNILIVDDFAHMCMAIKRMLNEVGEERIQFASSGEEAIRLITKERFDIVLCDYNLGEGKDGQQVLEESRLTGILAPTAVFVMITAETSTPYVLGAIEFQPDDYLTKPFTKELLVRRLRKAVERADVVRPIHQAKQRGQLEKAVELCKQGLSSGSRHLQAHARLLGGIYLEQHDYPRAAAFFMALLGRKDFPWARLGLGQAQYAQGDYAAASNTLQELLRTHPYYIEGYDWLARCSQALGDPLRAEKTLREGVALNPKAVARQRELGHLALANRDLDTANQAYRMAIRHGEHSCQRSAEEYLSHAEILLEQGKHPKALLTLKDAKKALSHRQDDLLQVSTGIVGVHLAQNRHLDAMEELANARSIYERHTDRIGEHAAFALARAALSSGDQEAIEETIGLLVKNHHDDRPFIEQVHRLVGESRCETDFDQLIDQAVAQMQELNSRGITLYEQGDMEGALRLFEKAAEEVPNNRSFNLNAAQVMLALMKERGVDDAMRYKSRRYLERVARHCEPDARFRGLVARYQQLFGSHSLELDA